MVFSWLKQRRREKILAQPFPAEWLEHLQKNVACYGYLSPADRAKLRDDLRVFVAEKNWEGCGGLVMTAEIKVTIAALACLMALGLDRDCFARVLSILVYPSEYKVPVQRSHGPLIVEGHDQRLGEAWYRGPVILSWDDVLWDARHPGEGGNLVFHEFAHQLDMLDRESDGTPPLGTRDQYRRWREVMTAEYDQLIADARAGRQTLLDPYGTTNEAEFFAVVTECFFDLPAPLRAEHPRLYQLLREYYRQNPVEWVPGAA
jgi:hypothetical protein